MTTNLFKETYKMFASLKAFSALALAGSVAIAAACSYASETKQKAAGKDIVDTAAKAGDFKTLVTAVKAADLVKTLKGEGPFTVFAPTDAAFAKLPDGTVDSLLKPENKGKLASILTFHVVPGKLTAEKVLKMKSLKTVQGQELKVQVTGGKAYVNGAMISATDVMASNGVIHVIDSVVLPK